MLASAVILTPGFSKAMKLPIVWSIFVLLIWCFFTSIWSEIPVLSLYKAFAASLVMAPLFLGGFLWASYQKNVEDIWRFFRWLVPAALLVGLLGRSEQGLFELGQNYYAGVAGNSNFLGWMMSVIFVPLFWGFMGQNGKSKFSQRLMYTMALFLSLYYLIASQSRGAMLTTTSAATFYFFSTSHSRRSKLLVSSALVLLTGFLLIPNLGEFVYQKFIVKGTGLDIAGSFEQSRAGVFAASLAGAEAGGFLGGGFGIIIGSDPSGYSGGVSSVGYGREKGNSILAVIEEIGLVGVIIFLLIFTAFFSKARSAYKKSRKKSQKAQVGFLAGYVFAMLVMSNFEAWLVAPGSPESLFFWSYFGVVYGLCFRIIRAHQYSTGVDATYGRRHA